MLIVQSISFPCSKSGWYALHIVLGDEWKILIQQPRVSTGDISCMNWCLSWSFPPLKEQNNITFQMPLPSQYFFPQSAGGSQPEELGLARLPHSWDMGQKSWYTCLSNAEMTLLASLAVSCHWAFHHLCMIFEEFMYKSNKPLPHETGFP